MKQEQPTDFFVGLKNAFWMVLPFYFLFYWLGLIAIPIYVTGCTVILWSIILLPEQLRSFKKGKEKRKSNDR